MTFEEALLKAGRAVTASSPNMSSEDFEERVPSLVVLLGDSNYQNMSIGKWRVHKPKPTVVLAVLHESSFGG